ncbi:MAG: aminotransferase class V-fold PLP-dependent enzyme [Acidobacteriia bacterium]|nr:aminotransferase class V-fold PLP-dependent enzyme [Terriglobia bacterium]
MKRIYMDYNATTPVEAGVLEAMLPYFSAEYGNAASIHSFGQKARAAVEAAREAVAALIGARAQEIVFTSGGTESDNHAIFGIVAAVSGARKNVAASGAGKDIAAGSGERDAGLPTGSGQVPPSATHVITTAVEHEAVLNACQALEKQGVAVTYLAVDGAGRVDPEAVRRALRAETALITVMHANNELGTVQPIEEIGKIAAEADVYFHTDAVQSAGKIAVDVERLGVDLLSLSGHKFYAPKGVGALYIRRGTRLRQLLYGGRHQHGFRPGTENVPGIVGLGKAAEMARAALAEDARRVGALRDRLERGLLERVPQARVNGMHDRKAVNGIGGHGGGGAARTPNTTNILFPGVEGEALVIALDLKGLACSTGAACSSGAVEPSHVLTAIGLPAGEARASLRFSLGRHTTEAEVDFALEVVPGAVAQLRELSPVYGRKVNS